MRITLASPTVAFCHFRLTAITPAKPNITLVVGLTCEAPNLGAIKPGV
jgi:hypothetical protein